MDALQHSPENTDVLTTLGLLFLRWDRVSSCAPKAVRFDIMSMFPWHLNTLPRWWCSLNLLTRPLITIICRSNDNGKALEYLGNSLEYDPRNPRTILASGSIIQVRSTLHYPHLTALIISKT